MCAIVQCGYAQKHFHCLSPDCGTLEAGRQLRFECFTLVKEKENCLTVQKGWIENQIFAV